MSWRISGALSSRPTSLLSARDRLPAHELKGAAAETTQERARTRSEDEASAERELSMLQSNRERSGHAFTLTILGRSNGTQTALKRDFNN